MVIALEFIATPFDYRTRLHLSSMAAQFLRHEVLEDLQLNIW